MNQLSILIETILKSLTLDDEARVSHIVKIRNYVRFVVKINHDKLDDDEKIIVDSLIVYMKRFFVVFTRVTNLIVTSNYKHFVYEMRIRHSFKC